MISTLVYDLSFSIEEISLLESDGIPFGAAHQQIRLALEAINMILTDSSAIHK